MSVWKRVRKYASESRHLDHSRQGRARGNQGDQLARARRRQGALPRRAHARGHRLRLRLHPPRRRQAGVPGEISRRAFSRASIPICICGTIGVANQTTMLRGETEEVQRRIRQAIIDRDGPELARDKFPFLRHDLRRDPGAAGCVARAARCADGPAARRRRLQQLEHLAPRGDGRGETADLFHPQRSRLVVRDGNPALRSARQGRR